MSHQHPSNATTCGLCWLNVPHDTQAHRQARAAQFTYCRTVIRAHHDRMRLVNRWQPLVSAMDAAALDAVGSWLIDEQADLARSADDAGRWLNRQLQRMVADEQEHRADHISVAGSAAA